MSLRVTTGVVAIAVIAWLAVMERDVRLQARGVEAAGSLHEAGNRARAEADLRAARLLNPDTAPDVARALVYKATGDGAQAVTLLEDVVRREPENLAAWHALLQIAPPEAPGARRARAAIRRLDPLNARRR